MMSSYIEHMEAEKQKLRMQVKRLCQENGWLRDELASTQTRLQNSEIKIVALEEENKDLSFRIEVQSKYEAPPSMGNTAANGQGQAESGPDSVAADLGFPDDDDKDQEGESCSYRWACWWIQAVYMYMYM